MINPRKPTYSIDKMFTERWSSRALSGERMTEEQLMTVLEAARWSPSASNLQPWRFIYAHRDTPAWQPIFDALNPFNQIWVARASALIVIASAMETTVSGNSTPAPIASHAFDAGAAWMALALQASSMGLVAHGMTGINFDQMRTAIALPENYALNAVIALGKPGDKSLLPPHLQEREVPNNRNELATMVFEGRF